MSTCSILNLEKEPSKLYDQLLEIFGNEMDAKVEYRKVIGPTFAKTFGDWEYNYKNPNKAQKETGPMDKSEPKLFHDKVNDLHFFKDKDMNKIFINKMKFSDMDPSDVKDVVGIIFSRFAKENERVNLGDWSPTKTNSGMILDSIDRTISDLRIEIAKSDRTQEEKQVLLERVDKVEKNRLAFRSELIVSISSLGIKVRERILNEDGTQADEVPMDERGGGLNIKESLESSSKDSASVKTKIWLSQIERRKKENGMSVPIKDGYLETESFAEFEDVWNTLNKVLIDTVGYGEGKNTIDLFEIMLDRLKVFADTKPFLNDVIDKLETAKKEGNTQMINEFTQAFNKTSMNYYVTKFDKDNYQVFNATESGSRRLQITNQWMNQFTAEWLDKNGNLDNPSDLDTLKDIAQEIADLKKKWGDIVKDAGTNTDSAGWMETMGGQEAGQIYAHFLEIMDEMGAKGIQNEDLSMLVAMNGGKRNHTKTITRLMNKMQYAVEQLANSVDPTGAGVFVAKDSDGNVPNIFKRESTILQLAEAVGFREVNMSETTVLLTQGKTGYAISNPTYVSNTVNTWKQEAQNRLDVFEKTGEEVNTTLSKMGDQSDKKNSQWINHLLAKGEGLSKKERLAASNERIQQMIVAMDSSFSRKGRDGVSNVDITVNDNINANIAQMLNSVLGDNRKSVFPTIIAADKSRRILFEGFDTQEYDFSPIKNPDGTLSGKQNIPDDAIEVAMGYFKDEYTRMRRVNRENENLPANKQVVHYHGVDGNGTKSQIFPELSRENTDPAFQEFRDVFYAVDTFKDPTHEGLTGKQEEILKKFIKASIEERVLEHSQKLSKLTGLSQDLTTYFGSKQNLAGNYFMNGLISSVEYTKLFSGDPAYYKNTADLLKRMPATYTDGLQLRLNSGDSLIFNQATVEGVEVASRYVDKIRKSLTDKSIAKAYDRVNTTDAQAWITPRRWKFLKEKLGQWSDAHEAVFQKMMVGQTLGTKEAKLAAQPLKGVYYEINDGRPVYLKYSQMVIMPHLAKGTPMQALYEKMTQDANGKPIPDSEAQNEIHEVITIDGVKVGAVAPTPIHKDGTTEMLAKKDIKLNTVRLSNRGWKLQQDLPIKRMHDTNVGSQVQKNIFEGLRVNGNYAYGKGMDGREIAAAMHETVSKLSDIGRKKVEEKFGIVDERMTDQSLLRDALIEEFKDRGGNDNVVEALQKNVPFDAIPQLKGKVESILMSMMSREIMKISTSGGSFIQVSPFGLETIGEDSGIIPLSDAFKKEGALLPPRIDEKTGKVLPGQAMIPHSQAVELLKKHGVDFAEIGVKSAMQTLDPSALELITYRIPNQGMSSNDYLEIVGILPDGMGDSIVVYDGLPAKTGSDFDIDKLYAMNNHVVYEPDTGKVTKLTEENRHLAEKRPARYRNGKLVPAEMYTEEEIDKMLLENQLVAQYKAVLNSPDTYDNMMRSIDGAQLKDDIVGVKNKETGEFEGGLFPAKKYKNMELFSPIAQLEAKRAYLAGKFGVAQTANQIVDHSMNQMIDVRLGEYLGVGNKRIDKINGKNKAITYFDSATLDVNAIADNLSAFLNAYVDIAKDPYISRGNHNALTAGTTFMLLRAGTPIKWVNRFIGQPIIRDLVALQLEQEALTAKGLERKGGVSISPIDAVMDKYEIRDYDKKANGNDVQRLTEETLEQAIRNEQDPANGKDLPIDHHRDVLSAYMFLKDKAKHFSAGVTAAKADTNGPGGSNVDRLINENRVEKVLSDGILIGWEEKLNNTMLKTYLENGNLWVGRVISNSDLFWSGNATIQGMFNKVSEVTGNDRLLIDPDLGRTIENNLYTYMMSGTQLFNDLSGESNRRNFYRINETVPKILNERKTASGNKTGNEFLNQLEIEFSNSGIPRISLDSKNKSTVWQNEMYRGWAKLYNTHILDENGKITDEVHPDRQLAIDLVKYSYSNSGFQNNLSQFFTSIPHQILTDNRLSFEVRDLFRSGDELTGDFDFVDQFQRHMHADRSIVRKLKSNQIKGGKDVFSYKPAEIKSREFGTVRIVNKKEVRVFPRFVTAEFMIKSRELAEKTSDYLTEDYLYEMIGTVLRPDAQSPNGKMRVPVYKRTFKMGSKDGRFKQFEYIRGQQALGSLVRGNNVPLTEQARINKTVNETMASDKTFRDNEKGKIPADYLKSVEKRIVSDAMIIKDNLEQVMALRNIKCK